MALSIGGSILYLAWGARGDVFVAVAKLARGYKKWTRKYARMLERIIRYLSSTADAILMCVVDPKERLLWVLKAKWGTDHAGTSEATRFAAALRAEEERPCLSGAPVIHG